MFSFFKKKSPNTAIDAASSMLDFSFLELDMHSHLVPGIDDGAKHLEDSVRFVEALYALGIRSIITTPHIHGEMYDNDTAKVQRHFQPLKDYVAAHLPELHIQVSAEYFLDNYFLNEVLPKGLMPFGNNNVLVEVSMAGWNRNFNDILFAVQANGYRPILAHPERYVYETNFSVYEQLKNKGVCLQMNLLSMIGYYGKTIQQNAQKLMDMGLYDYCGTDLHHERHLAHMLAMPQEAAKIMQQLSEYGFKNKHLYKTTV